MDQFCGYQGETEFLVQRYEFDGALVFAVPAIRASEFGGSLAAVWTLQGNALDTFGVGVQATRISGDFYDGEHHAIGFGLTSGPYSLHANYGVVEFDQNALPVTFFRAAGLGVSAGYDLGGGASVLAGYSTSTSEVVGNPYYDIRQYSLGMNFSF